MKTITEQGYTINVCTDIIEWAKEFYGMPEGAELENKDDVSKECMGFSQIDEKIVWVFIPDCYFQHELNYVIAHEIGHIIELEYPKNPDQIDGNDNLHELKADHYMNYYLLVTEIIAKVGAIIRS